MPTGPVRGRTLNPDVLDPRQAGLVVFDMLECYRERIVPTGAIKLVQRLIRECRARQVPIFYARADHRPDGADANRTPTDTDEALRPWEGSQDFDPPHPKQSYRVLSELAPQPGDYDIPKHRWNAFYQTCLDLSMRSQGIDTVLLVGGSTHVGIASTVFAARDMDYHVVVVRDGLTGYEPQRTFFVEQVFPRMCRVRTIDEVVAMFDKATT